MEGIADQISVGAESTWGTAVTPDVSLPIAPSDGIQIEANVTGVESIKGTAPKNKGFFLGQRRFNGGYEMGVYPKVVGHFLNALFGTDTVTEPESGVVYKHTFSEAVTKPSLTVEQAIGDIVKRFNGYVPKNLKFSLKVGEQVMVAVDGMAKGQASASKITAAYDTTRAFSWDDVTELSIGGTDIKAYVEEMELEIDNGLEFFHGLGDLDAAAKYVKQSEAKGSITAYVNSTTAAYLTDLMAGTERELILELTGASIGASSNDILKFTLSKCAFFKTDTAIDYDYNAVKIEFEAREDATNGLVKTELTNVQASY